MLTGRRGWCFFFHMWRAARASEGGERARAPPRESQGAKGPTLPAAARRGGGRPGFPWLAGGGLILPVISADHNPLLYRSFPSPRPLNNLHISSTLLFQLPATPAAMSGENRQLVANEPVEFEK